MCVELYQWSIELEGRFVLPLAPRWVRLLFIEEGYKRSPILVGYHGTSKEILNTTFSNDTTATYMEFF